MPCAVPTATGKKITHRCILRPSCRPWEACSAECSSHSTPAVLHTHAHTMLRQSLSQIWQAFSSSFSGPLSPLLPCLRLSCKSEPRTKPLYNTTASYQQCPFNARLHVEDRCSRLSYEGHVKNLCCNQKVVRRSGDQSESGLLNFVGSIFIQLTFS